ncbi:hypothetical protein CYMTET_21809, partial [Cymbomonas tetramitiformis]
MRIFTGALLDRPVAVHVVNQEFATRCREWVLYDDIQSWEESFLAVIRAKNDALEAAQDGNKGGWLSSWIPGRLRTSSGGTADPGSISKVNADWQKKLDKVVQESAAEQRKHAQELQEKDSKLSHLEAELAEREKGIEEGNEVEEDGKGSGTAVQEEKEETREGGTSDVAISSHLNPGTLSAACDTQELQKKLSHLNTILTVKSTRIYDLQEELRASHKAHTEEVEKMKQAHEKALQKTLDDHKTSTTELKEQLKRAAERSTAAGNAVQLESELAEWKSKATRWYAELISMREWKEQTNAVPDTTRTSSDVVEALNFSNLLFGNPAAAEVVRDEPDQPELEAPLSSPRLPAEELGELMPDLAACKAAQRRIEKSSTPSDRGDTMSNSSLNSYNSELTDGQRRKSSLSGYSRKLSGSGVLTGRDVKTLSPEILAARNEAK